MLNIGKLGPGAAEYYVGEIATTVEDYYLGNGEAPGRWVGSLAAELGLAGQVGEAEFRRVLEGKHPASGEYLVSAQGSAMRAAARKGRRPAAAPGQAGAALDTLQVAAQLGVSERRVQQLLAAGIEVAAQTPSATQNGDGGDPSPAPTAYLLGTKVEIDNELPGGRREVWRVEQTEVDRFAAGRRRAIARPGYDLVLRPPKSVSVLWAVGDEAVSTAIRDAHRLAVDAVVRYVEAQAVHARCRRSWIETHGIVAAAFDHRTSRAGDPLLHTHVVTANMTHTVQDKWRAIDGRGLFDHGRSGGYLYHAHLRHTLTESLGLAWEPVVNGYADVVGVPRPVVEAFSKRREEITDLVAESGLSSARAHQTATLMTRRNKEHGVEPATLRRRWTDEAAELGFGAEQVAGCLGRASIERASAEQMERLFDRLAAPDGLTERAASFNRCEVIEALATCLGHVVDGDELGVLADRFLGSARVVPLVGAETGRAKTIIRDAKGTMVRAGGMARFTTPDLLRVEAQVLAWGEEGFGMSVPMAWPNNVGAALARRPELSGEQVAMVEAVCSATEAIQPVVGRAGSGKTYGLDACVEAFLASGVPVVGCTVSASAAARLEEATSLERRTGRPADTIAKLLVELDDPFADGFAPRTVCLVDEASTVGTRDLARLAGHVARAGGAIKLIGDPDQLSSVDVGGSFRVLATRKGDDLVTLTANHRQRDETERQAVAEYREGKVALAMKRYDDAGKVVRARSAAECYDALVADWYADRLAGINEPMIAGPNAIRRQLNERARALLAADGTLVGPGLNVAGKEFCVGDDVVTRANDRHLHGENRRLFVRNGSLGTVTVVDVDAGEVEVDFRREGRIRLPADYLARGKLEHAYARTNFLAQGQDLRRTKYHPTDSSRFEEGYVGLTRAVEETRIYIVDGYDKEVDDDVTHQPTERVLTGLETVIAALGERGAKEMATELDPLTAGAATVFGSLADLSLSDLKRQRRKVDAILEAAPPSYQGAIDRLVESRETLLARRRSWAATEVIASSPDAAVPATREHELDRQLSRTEHSLSCLEELQQKREHFLADHAVELNSSQMLRSAEAVRTVQLRSAAAADPPEDIVALLGPLPESRRHRLAWSDATNKFSLLRDAGHPDGADLDEESQLIIDEALRLMGTELQPGLWPD